MLITTMLSAALLMQTPSDRAEPMPPAPPVAALEFAGYNDAGDVRLVIDAPTVSRLSRQSRAAVRLAITPLESISLDLQRFEVIAPDAQFFAGSRNGQIAIRNPDVVFMRGTIVGEPLSHVFLALSTSDATHGLGTLTRQTGERWHIGTDRTGAASSLVMRRGVGDVPEFDHFCSVIPLDDGNEGGLAGIIATDAAGPRVLNMAVDSDQQFWMLFNDDQAAINYIAMIMGAVSDIYIRDLNMRVALRWARIWPSGGEPFAANNLSGFRQFWHKNEDMDGINMVHMFSGARSTSYGGVAYLSNACTGNAFGISAFLNGSFPSPIVGPNLGNWDVNVVAHEMGHNLGTPHTHDLDPPVDTCAQGSTERGTIMSYCHTRAGGLLNIDMVMHAANQDIIAEDHPLTSENCLWHDCNGNLLSDVEDIVFGVSIDSNGDWIPDECQDCDSNGILDPIDIANGTPDINANGIPDSCESDCNGNGQPDRWECAQNPSIDQNGNRVPDSCEPDCNGNGIADFIDIADGTSVDLDRNSRPDTCDDCNANGVADWIDYGRAFNVVMAQSSVQTEGGTGGGTISGPLREYHAASGVVVQAPALAGVDALDVVFGADRQPYLPSLSENRVIRFDLDAGVASTFIAPGSGGLNGPTALCFGTGGDMFVASQNDSRILRFNSVTGAFVSTFVNAGSGGLAQPWDVLFDADGDLLVLTEAAGVLKYDGTTGAFIGVLASPANLNQPRGMCLLNDGRLLVTDRGDNTIRAFSATGVYLGVWNDQFPVQSPWGIVVGPNGHVYTARMANPVRIVEYATNGRYIRSFIRGDDELIAPTSIAFRPASPADANQNFILDVCENACTADIAPLPLGDGVVNVSDLLAVITNWGSCPMPPTACVGDIAPPSLGDGEVNVSDLLAIITSWGPCN